MKKWWKLLLVVIAALPVGLIAAFALAVALTPLSDPVQPEATLLYDQSNRPLARLYTQNRIELPVAQMPKHLLNAIVAVEDGRFYGHHGLDIAGIARALMRNVSAGGIKEGGSTLSQQLAKNLYLTHERTLWRKIKEAILTVKLESRYSKDEILGLYWNTIYLGDGAYGVEVASHTYFGKSARDLTLAEAALLAGLPRSPEYYNPQRNVEVAAARRNLVLEKMATQGFITNEQAADAKAEAVHLADAVAADTQAPYFLDFVTRQLRAQYPDIARSVYQGGYRVYTTLDLTAQRAAEEAVTAQAPRSHLDGKGVRQPQVALVALEPETGYVRAMVGGRGEQVDRNRALEPLQPGSAFKPFVYAAALETGKYTVASSQLDTQTELHGPGDTQTWRPSNNGNRYSHQPVMMRDALRQSLNVVAARWIDALTPGPVIETAHRMGIKGPIPYTLTLALGTAEVSPLELTQAYAPLANGGYAVKPTAIRRIEDRDGNIIVENRPVRRRALDSGVAFIVTDMLKDVLHQGGTAASIGTSLGGRPAAGKTGTTDNARDSWFVGYTPDLVASVWVGNDDRRPGAGDGGTVAAPIWAQFINRALRSKSYQDWTPPANVESRAICLLTGLRPNASCPAVNEWFLTGTAPTAVDPTVHWDRILPSLPGIPWAPSGGLPQEQSLPVPLPGLIP